MATRFGGSRPGHAKDIKMRWVVGCLVIVCFVLVIAIVVILQPGDLPATQNQTTPTPQQANQPAQGGELVLVAGQRIEVGTALVPTMFKEERYERVPQNAIHAYESTAIMGMYASRLILPSYPLLKDDITHTPPTGLTEIIPPGFRAVAIEVDKVSSVEGFTRPNTRVDVLWTFTDRDRTKKVAKIVRFAKILSFGGATAAANNANTGAAGGKGQEQKSTNTVTLLVSEREASVIELARNSGSLGLVLVGSVEPQGMNEPPEIITVPGILGDNQPAATNDNPVEGRMFVKDEKTGRMISFCLSGRQWSRCEEE